MKKKLSVALVGLALVGAGAAFVLNKRQHLAHQQRPVVLPAVVETKTLAAGHVKLTLHATADVQAMRDSVVASRLSGYVTALSGFEGDRFKKGDVLAKLDASQAEADLQRVSAVLAQSRLQEATIAAELAAAESNLKAEEDRLTRAETLYKIQFYSMEQLQRSHANFAAARARYATAHATMQGYSALLKANQTAVSAARENLRYAAIAAPFDGVVSQRLVQAGDLVTPGKPLLKIIDVSAGARLLVYVPEGTRALELQVGDQKLPLAPWPEGGPQGLRRFEARSAGNAFMPGTRVSAQLVVFKSPQAVLLPRQCLLNDDGRTGTILVLKENQHQAGLKPTNPEFLPVSNHSAQTEHRNYNAPQEQNHPHKPQGDGAPAHQSGHAAPAHKPGNAPAESHHPGQHPARSSGKIETLRVSLAAAGEEGAASTDSSLAGKRVVCGSPDVLSRVLAGVPFSVKSGE